MRFSYPIGPETGRKVVVDGEVDLRLSPAAAMVAGVLLAGVPEGSGEVSR
jgi:hypothetical protein